MVSYDYIQRYLCLKPNNNLYHILWNEYERIMNEQIETVDFIIRSIRYYGNVNRLRLLKFVLAQIPLYKWKDTLEKSGFLFLKEAHLLNSARNLNKDGQISLILDSEKPVIEELEEIIRQETSS